MELRKATEQPPPFAAEPDLAILVAGLERTLAEQRRFLQAIVQTRVNASGRLAAAARATGDHSVVRRAAAMESSSGQSVLVWCLGAFKLQVCDITVTAWRPGRARALFQYLVTHRDYPVPRAALINALWPNPDAKAADASLKVALHALRQTLASIAADPVAIAIDLDESGYQLHGPGIWLDVEEFERCAAIGEYLERQGEHAAALAMYVGAADLYRGDFLEESWDDWAMFRRETLKDQYLLILGRLVYAALQADEYQECIRRCQQLLEKDRCREDAFRMLLLCHGRLGQRERVRRWYELCVATLRAELDVEPEPETTQLYRRAMAGRV